MKRTSSCSIDEINYKKMRIAKIKKELLEGTEELELNVPRKQEKVNNVCPPTQNSVRVKPDPDGPVPPHVPVSAPALPAPLLPRNTPIQPVPQFPHLAPNARPMSREVLFHNFEMSRQRYMVYMNALREQYPLHFYGLIPLGGPLNGYNNGAYLPFPIPPNCHPSWRQ